MEFRYQKIVILTGAGISAESGVRTFRDTKGLWEDHRVEDVASPQGFQRNPLLVWQFYSMRRQQANQVRPNRAHLALANVLHALEKAKLRSLLITQNIDTLHERAFGALPNKNFIDIHGTLSRSRCVKCNQTFSDRWIYFDAEKSVETYGENLWSNPAMPALLNMPRRDAQGIPQSPCCNQHLRPDIVWFGERPQGVEKAVDQLTSCNLFVSIGTSGNVYPAAGFAAVARKAGAHTVCINLEPPENSRTFHEHIAGVATEKVPEFFKKL